MLTIHVRRALIPSLVLAVVLALTGSTSAQESRNALVLTVGSPGTKLRTKHVLTHAGKDAENFAAVFRAQEGKLFGNVWEKTLAGEQATSADTRTALRELVQRARRGDVAVLGFIGHGGISRGSGEWVYETRDWDGREPYAWNGGASCDQEGRPVTCLTASDLRAAVSALTARGVLVVVFVDTCHAGALDLHKQGAVVFAACLAEEEGASLTALGSRNLGERAGGLFTTATLEALSGKADANGDGVVTLAEAEAYISARVDQLNAKLNKLLRQKGVKQNSQRVACGRPLSVPSSMVLVQLRPTQPRPGRPVVKVPPEANPGR